MPSLFSVSPCQLIRWGCLAKVALMGSERLLSSRPMSVPITYSRRTGRRAMHAADLANSSKDEVIKEEASMPSADIISIRRDPSRLEKMTLLELRKTVRSIGISAKGTKKDLLRVLKGFLEEVNENSILPEEADIVETQVVPNRKAASKRKADIASGSICYSETKVELVSLNQRKKPKEKGLPVLEVQAASTCAIQEISKSDEKVSDQKPPNLKKPWEILAHKKPQSNWVAYNPNTMRPSPLSNATKKMKIMSWNVNGLRALLKLESFSALELAQKEDFDVLCLQETKLQEKDVEKIKQTLIEGYDSSFWTCSVSKLGYSGTAIISRIKPLSVTYGLGIANHDTEGRLVTVEFDTFYLLCGYVPNAGDGLKRLSYRIEEWDPSLSKYMKNLEKSKPVILTGDLNCAHQEMDIYNPAGNRRSAGFTDEERESFDGNFLAMGFVDTFRKQHPNAVGYTYWGFRHGGRASNRGWRLDYFLVSESIADEVHDSFILPEIMGSDHCPIGLVLKL